MKIYLKGYILMVVIHTMIHHGKMISKELIMWAIFQQAHLPADFVRSRFAIPLRKSISFFSLQLLLHRKTDFSTLLQNFHSYTSLIFKTLFAILHFLTTWLNLRNLGTELPSHRQQSTAVRLFSTNIRDENFRKGRKYYPSLAIATIYS